VVKIVKYSLEIGNDIALITPELKDKYPKLVDLGKDNKPLKKVAKQRAVYVYVDEQGKEQTPTGKGISRGGEIVELHKVENLKAFDVKSVNKDEMFNYSIQGTFRILKTSLSLKDDEALTFIWALAKGYTNTVRGFIYKRNGEYFLIKTSVATIETLSKSFVIAKEEVKEQKQTLTPTQMLNLVGVEA